MLGLRFWGYFLKFVPGFWLVLSIRCSSRLLNYLFRACPLEKVLDQLSGTLWVPGFVGFDTGFRFPFIQGLVSLVRTILSSSEESSQVLWRGHQKKEGYDLLGNCHWHQVTWDYWLVTIFFFVISLASAMTKALFPL